MKSIRKWVFTLAGLTAFTTPLTTAHADQIRDDQWHLDFLGAPEAHKLSLGEGARVAVIDTGVDPHPDVRQNVLSGTDLVDGFGDGRLDEDSHGTSMAGLVAAHGSSPDAGALGLAPRAKVLPIRYRTAFGQVDTDALAAGVRWALKNDASVISISSVSSPSAGLRQAIHDALAADVVVVAAAGNRPSSQGVGFPAAFEGVVAVGATDRNGNHAAVSVTGKQIALSAPGVDIYSTSIDGKYSKATGTSASTAIVAGAAALVRSKYPDLSSQEVVHRLTATATDKGPPGRDEQYGYGVLNVVAALTAHIPPKAHPTSTTATPSGKAAPPPGEPGGGKTTLLVAILSAVTVTVTATAVLIGLRRRRSRTD